MNAPTLLIAAADAMADAKNAPAHATDRTVLGQWIVDWAAPMGIVILLLCVCLCLYRLCRGPHLADRVLAGDTFAIVVVGIVVLFTVMLENDLFFDAALVVSIIGFASTVAFSQFIGARRKHAPDLDPADGPPATTDAAPRGDAA